MLFSGDLGNQDFFHVCGDGLLSRAMANRPAIYGFDILIVANGTVTARTVSSKALYTYHTPSACEVGAAADGTSRVCVCSQSYTTVLTRTHVRGYIGLVSQIGSSTIGS